MIITSVIAAYVPNTRVLMMILNCAVGLVGMIIVYCTNDKATEMVGLVLSVIPAVNTPLAVSLITANIAGRTKRSCCSALFFITYCIGNIIGPQFYMNKEKPSFPVSLPHLPQSF